MIGFSRGARTRDFDVMPSYVILAFWNSKQEIFRNYANVTTFAATCKYCFDIARPIL